LDGLCRAEGARGVAEAQDVCTDASACCRALLPGFAGKHPGMAQL